MGCFCSLGHLLAAQGTGPGFYTSVSLSAYFSMVAQLTSAEQVNSFLFRVHTDTGTFICAMLLEKFKLTRHRTDTARISS